jgi:[ribosomal protein S18]-alanine N-acetyltransferase
MPYRSEPTTIIRPMAARDVDEVLKIDLLSFSNNWVKEGYLQDLKNPHTIYLVAEENGRIAGYAGMIVVEEESHLTTLAIHPGHRRQGLGRSLFEEMLRAAMLRGAEKMTLEVKVGNVVAQRLYEQYGFIQIAYIKGYYRDTGEDAVVMSLNPLRLELIRP